jgi:uncharacterized protein (UPF0276 family)
MRTGSRGVEYGEGNGETNLTPNLNMKKHACELVPKNLSEIQKLARRHVCFETLENCSRYEIFKTESIHKKMAVDALVQN